MDPTPTPSLSTARPRAQLKCYLSPAQKQAFAALAASQGMSASALLARLVADRTADATPRPASPPARHPHPGRPQPRIHLRFDPADHAAARRLADADGRSLPRWCLALIRRSLLKAVVFNDAELQVLRSAVIALGRLGRNVNTLVHNLQRSGRGDPTAIEVAELHGVVRQVQLEVRDLLDRASNRYQASP